MLLVSDALTMANCTPLPDILMPLPICTPPVVLNTTPGGVELISVLSSTTGAARVLVSILTDLVTRSYPLPGETSATPLVGLDGTVYLGTESGKLYRFDPTNGALEELGELLHNGGLVNGFVSSTGKLFFGSSHEGTVVEYDPETGSVGHYLYLCQSALRSCAVNAFAELPDGRIAAFVHGTHPEALLITADGKTWERATLPGVVEEYALEHVVSLADGSLLTVASSGHIRQLEPHCFTVLADWPELPDGNRVHCLTRVGTDILASGCANGAIYRWRDAAWEQLGIPMPGDPMLFVGLPEGRIAGLTSQGRLVLSSADKRMFTLHATPNLIQNGMEIVALGIGPDHKLYYAPGGSMQVGQWDPATEELAPLFVAASFPGEVSAFGFAGERLFMGFANDCGVMAYYPEYPHRLGDNPQLIGLLDESLLRPLGPMVHHGREVYFVTFGGETTDGALVQLNPTGSTLKTFPEIIPDHNITSLVVDRLNELFVIGGAPRNEGDSAALVCWDPYTQQVVRRITPFSDAETVQVWATEGGHAYVTDGDARYAVINIADGVILESGDFPLGPITTLLNTLQGELYGIAGGFMFHWDISRSLLERLTPATGKLLTEINHDIFAYTDAGRIFIVRMPLN